MKRGAQRLHSLFFGPQGVGFDVDRRRAHNGRLRDLGLLGGRTARMTRSTAVCRRCAVGAGGARPDHLLARCRSAGARPSSNRRPGARRAGRFCSPLLRPDGQVRPGCCPSAAGRFAGLLGLPATVFGEPILPALYPRTRGAMLQRTLSSAMSPRVLVAAASAGFNDDTDRPRSAGLDGTTLHSSRNSMHS